MRKYGWVAFRQNPEVGTGKMEEDEFWDGGHSFQAIP